MASRPGTQRRAKLSATTISHRLGLLRTFFERIIEWDYDDAPAASPIFAGDLPERDEPLPKFLDDPTAAKFMAALAADPNPRRRLMVELLARTGMRSGELAGLEDRRHGPHRRHPLAAHPRRQAPQRPLRARCTPCSSSSSPTGSPPAPPSRSGRLVERDDGQPFDRRTIHRYVAAVAKRAGVGHVHPHQLRHTLATQAINRGMSLEAIAALLGHRSMRMTLTYARISDRTVADEYFRVTEAVEATTDNATPLPADVDGPNMRRLAADHRRLLGNGHCTRPVALDCIFETDLRTLRLLRDRTRSSSRSSTRQRDHAASNDQPDRAELFTHLLDDIDNTT